MNVLITGASSGIGRALALAYAGQGDHVWVAARREQRLRSLVDEIEKSGGRADAVVLDVGQADTLAELIASLDEQAGGFDLVIANAGIGGKGATASGMHYADAKAVFEVNFLGAIATLLAAKEPMLKRGRGHLVGVSSLAGELPLPVAGDYGAAKAGLSYFVETMRHDLVPRGIDVTLILPGFVKSEITDKNAFPMPFIIEADHAARIMVRAIAKKKRVLRFPLAYRLLFALVRWVPLSLVGRLALRATSPHDPSG